MRPQITGSALLRHRQSNKGTFNACDVTPNHPLIANDIQRPFMSDISYGYNLSITALADIAMVDRFFLRHL